MLPTIHSYGPNATIHWLRQGASLYKKQFIRLSLLFILSSVLLSTAAALPIIGIVFTFIYMPLSQMLMFNAAYGTHLRGHFFMSDLRQKLHTGKIWSRLCIATFIHIIIALVLTLILVDYLLLADSILSVRLHTSPSLSMSDPAYSFSNILLLFLCLSLYWMLSIWVYPLICWEGLPVVRAFILSFKGSMSNAIALSLLIVSFIGITLLALWMIITVFSTAGIVMMVLLILCVFIISTWMYISFFAAYMDIYQSVP